MIILHPFAAKSFVDMTRYLLKRHKGCELFLLSECVSQDSVENYFGKQRARGGRNDNPTLKQCLVNDGALRFQNSHALDPVRGNCLQKRHLYGDTVNVADMALSNPLPKRPRRAIQ